MDGKYVITILFDNGIRKDYARNKFYKVFDILEEPKLLPVKEKHYTADVKKYGRQVINKLCNEKYAGNLIEFRYLRGNLYRVFFEHKECGYIDFGKTLKMSYYVHHPIPELHKYLIEWDKMPKWNVNYEFNELITSDIKMAFNNLLYSSSQSPEQWIEQTRKFPIANITKA